MAAGTLLAQAHGDGVNLLASGSWTAEYARTLEPLVEAVAGAKTAPRTIAIDVAQIERIDTYGAWLIERTLRAWSSRGVETRLFGLPDRHRGLFEKVQAGTHILSPLPPKTNPIIATLESVGRTMNLVAADVLLLFQMGGALALAFLRVLVRPHTFRFTSLVKHLERVAWNAVPIILLITLLIGAIIAQQGIFHFRTFGADLYVVDMVGVLVLRELGVVIVCIMVAGRSGSAYTAELGSMKMREEVDALRIMGFDPVIRQIKQFKLGAPGGRHQFPRALMDGPVTFVFPAKGPIRFTGLALKHTQDASSFQLVGDRTRSRHASQGEESRS